MKLLERLRRQLVELENSLTQPGAASPDIPEDPAEETALRAALRELMLAAAWPELDEEVVEAIDEFLAPEPVPRYLIDRALASIRRKEPGAAGQAAP
ncbi:MAG: hypothetical protein ACPLRW_06745 [Moorellales bacterium]